MAKKPIETHTLVDQEQALRVYLDALLCEIDVGEQVVSANTGDEDLAQDATEISQDAAAIITGGALPAETTAVESAEPASPSDQIAEAVHDATAQHPQAGQLVSSIPEWARQEFQSLSFQVSGLTLAAPLEKLNGIVELTEHLTELPGYSPWVLGVLNNRGQNVQVIDIGQIVMPKNRHTMKPASANSHSKYIVLINSGNFGLAADSLSQVLTLSPEDVRWRGASSKRPWLAGTVIEQMCAILDIDRLVDQLRTGIQV